ncbi:MAG: hypothetical protein J2P33_09815 [Actinobacteria bacterium]|nr:hypothetical protein [Actinomycetota bacterium]
MVSESGYYECRWGFDPAVSEKVLQPHGRQPHQVLIRLWDWYARLPERDEAFVRHVMRIAAYSSVFGLFAMLDGSTVIDNPPHGQLRLTYIGPDASEQPLNLTGQVSIADVDELRALDHRGISLYRGAS